MVESIVPPGAQPPVGPPWMCRTVGSGSAPPPPRGDPRPGLHPSGGPGDPQLIPAGQWETALPAGAVMGERSQATDRSVAAALDCVYLRPAPVVPGGER